MKNSRLENTFPATTKEVNICASNSGRCVVFFFFFMTNVSLNLLNVGLYSPLMWLRWHLQQASHFILQLSQFKHVILTADAQGTFWHSGNFVLKRLTRLSIRRKVSIMRGRQQRAKQNANQVKGGKKHTKQNKNYTQAFRYTVKCTFCLSLETFDWDL